MTVLLLFICGSCSNTEQNDTNLERTVLLGLLEELETLNISEGTKDKINSIASVALSEDAKVSDILQATSDLNKIKNEFLDEPLIFIDTALKAKVCKILGKNENSQITVREVLNIRELDLSYSTEDEDAQSPKIHYITDLRKFPVLKKVNLNGNELYSIDGIEHLSSLTQLSLSGCLSGDSATDITPLTKASNIESLDLSKNNIETIAPLSTLKNLYSLNISNTQASDIFVIAGFTNLKELGIGGLTVNGEIFTALSSLTTLDISGTVFTTAPKIHGLTELKVLTADNLETDITSAVSLMTKLTSLSMSRCNLTSIEFLSKLSELQSLNLSDNKISDTTPLQNKAKLTKLNLSKNSLEFFSAELLSELMILNVAENSIAVLQLPTENNSLVRLIASDNKLTEIRTGGTSGITELNIANNPISEGSFLRNFTEVKKIIADNTKFTNIDLTNCKNLLSLSLRNVPLETTAGLMGLTYLQNLDLYGSGMADITAFSQMSELRSLTATFKNVTDYTPLSGLINIESVEIYRMNNADWTAFNSMKTLKSVYIENSYMKEPSIKELPELIELTIMDCPYMTGTSSITNLPNLKKLTIIGSDIPTPVVRDLPKLETLIISECDVEYPEKIAELPSLKYLDISKNDLESLTFSELHSLEYLDVSDCRVVTIKDLNAEMSYGTLILANNYISDISVLDDVYKSLRKLDVSNNKIKNYSSLDSIEIGEVIAHGNKAEYIPKNVSE